MKRIKNIITDLKTFAYPEKQTRQEVFNLARSVEAAMRIAAHNINDCKMSLEIPNDLRVRASETQTVQILINLLTNGAKAVEKVPDRAGELCVKAVEEGLRVKICVRDNGVGISPENISKVFDPFFTTRDPGQGMGLGLSICQTIVRNHGGKITIDSNPGHWTEVCFDLPSASEELG
jgi:two-component system sensor histidine kinase PhcS